MHGFAKQIFKVFSTHNNISVTFTCKDDNNNGAKGEHVAKLFVKEIADLVLYEEPLEEHLHQQEKMHLIILTLSSLKQIIKTWYNTCLNNQMMMRLECYSID